MEKDGKSRRDIARSVGRQYSSIQHVTYNFKSIRVYTSKPHLSRRTKFTIREKQRMTSMEKKKSVFDCNSNSNRHSREVMRPWGFKNIWEYTAKKS
ncbi:hypothetical protein TNCV_1155761 [Trichonephila clavipes]|nr:hypothetical protein TNCV_1155761 [Trichonephila clavipes]